jgi:hypothetical protein
LSEAAILIVGVPQQFMMYRGQYEAWAAASCGSKLWLTARSLYGGTLKDIQAALASSLR